MTPISNRIVCRREPNSAAAKGVFTRPASLCQRQEAGEGCFWGREYRQRYALNDSDQCQNEAMFKSPLTEKRPEAG